jgi:hypothetical protein
MNLTQAFRPRQNTGYEIWFGTVRDKTGIALWFRYTILHRPDHPSVCALWAAFFDPLHPAEAMHAADSWPAAEQRFENGRIVQPTGSFSSDDVQGNIGDLSWNLQMEHEFSAESHVPSALLKIPFVRTKSIVLSPFAQFKGTIQKGGQAWQIDGRGTWTHIFGTQRVPELYWCFVPQFDNADAGMEVFSVRPKIGMPMLTFFTLREGRSLKHTGILGALRNSCQPEFPRFAAAGPGKHPDFRLESTMDLDQAASFIYVDPDSTNRYVVQSDVSSARLSLASGMVLESARGAAVEFHGLKPWHNRHFLDPYRKHDAR